MVNLIPRAFIDEIISITDIVDLIDSYLPLKKQGQNYVACCPFHNEKTPSFSVVPKKQFYHCFGCGTSGNVISFVMEYSNLGFVDAIEQLASRAGIEVPRTGGESTEEFKKKKDIYETLVEVNNYYQQTLKQTSKAIDYLKHRSVSGEIAKRYQLGFADNQWHSLEYKFKKYKKELITTGMIVQKDSGETYDRYRQRITFPIHDTRGRIIGFGGRSIDDTQKPKYLNSPETAIFHKSKELYGLHQVISNNKNIPYIIVVEGYMDVIALAQVEVPFAVATLGTATSTQHLQLLSNHTNSVIFCFDGDDAGRQAAWRALENALPILNKSIEIRFCFLPDGHDPDSLIREIGKTEFHKYLSKSMLLDKYLFEKLAKDIDTKSIAGKNQLINAAKPFIQKMPEGAFKDLILVELAKRTQIDSDRIKQLTSTYTKNTEEKEINITRTPLRLAIGLILQNPHLVLMPEIKSRIKILEKIENVLGTLVQYIFQNPDATTGKCIEVFRETEFFNSMQKLASWNTHVPQNAYKSELLDILHFFEKQDINNQIDKLLIKAKSGNIATDEREMLTTLLKKRHLLAAPHIEREKNS